MKITVTLPDGTIAKRTTNRTYTHAIVVQDRDNDTWGAISYCGNLVLAHKALAQYQAKSWYKNAQIVPVNETTLNAWALNDKLTAEALATPLTNDDMGREFHPSASL